MTTQYTPILKLALPVQGELSGTWGDVVNDNITSMIEQAIAGRLVINTWSGNSHTLTTANGTTAEARAAMLSLTDSNTQLGAAGTVVCPALSKTYIVKNGAGQIITVKTPSGSGIAIPNGKTMLVYCDGTNVLEGVDHVVTLSAGTLTITGLTTFASLKGADATTVTGILDEDNMNSNSNVKLATQQSIKAYVDAQVGSFDTLAEVLANGNTTGGADIVASTDDKVQFRDAAIYINSGADGHLDVVADTEVQIVTSTLNVDAAVDLSSTLVLAGNADFNGDLDVDGTTNLDVVDIDGAVDMASTLQVDGAATFTTEITANGGIALGDNDKATFGASDDLQIYHNANQSFIEDAGTGDLYIRAADNLRIQSYSDNEDMIKAVKDGAVTLYHNNAIKIATTATGVDVTGTVTSTGTSVFASLDISGDIDVDGTANLDVVDIDGAVDISGNLNMSGSGLIRTNDGSAANPGIRIGVDNDNGLYRPTSNTIGFSTGGSERMLVNSTGLDVTGTVTANAGVKVDNFTLDGTTLALSSGDMTLDSVAGDIILDAHGNQILFKGSSGQIGFIDLATGRMDIKASNANADMRFQGNDGGVAINALTLDMSAAGAATFNSGATFGASVGIVASGAPAFSIQDSDGTNQIGTIGHNGGETSFTTRNNTANGSFKFYTHDGSTFTDRFNIASSGAATFSSSVTATGLTVNSNEDQQLTLNSTDSSAVYAAFKRGGVRKAYVGYGASNSNFQIANEISDGDIQLLGNDGGSTITALTLDMSAAGAATFNAGATFGDAISTLSNDNGISFQSSQTANNRIQIFFKDHAGAITSRVGNDISGDNTAQLQFIAGTGSTPQLTIASSGAATFNSSVTATSLDISGNIDVDGTTNLDVVDIDGAVDMATTALFSKAAYGAIGSEDFYRIKFKDHGGTANDVGIGQPNFDSIGFNFTPTSIGGLFFTGGTLGEVLRLTGTGAVFNEGGLATSDFRVGSDSNANMLFVDGSTNRVGIGTASPSEFLHISTASDNNLGNISIGLGGPNLTNARGARITKNTSSPFELTIQSGMHPSSGAATIFKSANSVETMRITASGNVGIGTASPASLVSGGSSPVLSIGGTDSVLTTGEKAGSVSFITSDPSFTGTYSDGITGEIASVSDSSVGGAYGLAFYTGTTTNSNRAERARLTSNGSLLVGTLDTSPVGNNVAGGIALLNNGSGQFSRDGGTALLLNRKSSDGELLRFNKDSAIAGGIGVNDGDVYIGTGDTTLRFADSANAVIPRGTNGAVRDAAVSLGNGSNRFSDLYLSGGVFLGGSGAANKLDDYEEGTWTPVFKDSSNNSASAGTASGTYVKIGSVVHVQGNLININTSGLTSGDIALLIGLPFVINTASATRCHGLLQTNDVTFSEGTPYIQGINNQSKCNFRFNKTGAVAQGMAVNTFSSGVADVFFSMSYQTTA